MRGSETGEIGPRGIKPRMHWESLDVTSSTVLWWDKVENRYQAEVQCDVDAGYATWLRVFDRFEEDALIHDEQIDYPYGIERTPDMDDIETWREKVAAVVYE